MDCNGWPSPAAAEARGTQCGRRPPLNPSVRLGRRRLVRGWRFVAGAAALLIIAIATQVGHAETVSACGMVRKLGDCLAFFEYGRLRTYLLPDDLDLVTSEVYHLTGESYLLPWSCGPVAERERLRDVSVASCTPETLGCGVVHLLATCHLWQSLDGRGRVLLPVLDGFTDGDTALISGIRCLTCVDPEGCPGDAEILWPVHLSACPAPVNPVLESSWGRVKERYRK